MPSGWATRGSELRLTTWWPPSSYTPDFSTKWIFPEYWPAGPGTHRTLVQYSHGHVPELCLTLPWCTAAGGIQHRSPVPIYPLGLDKTNFPRILNTLGAKGATIPTTRTRSRTWTWSSGWATRVSEIRLTTWPLVLYPGFLDKTNFPRILIRQARTHRTLLQYPHGLVPELCLALPWCTAAWGTQHRFPVPIYPLGFDKSNFPRILNPRGAKGATIPTTLTWSRTWTLTSGWATRGSELRLTSWTPPSSCNPGFSIKRIFPKYWPTGPSTHRTLLHYPHGPVPDFCLALP